MLQIPNTLEETVNQAKEATKIALEEGLRRIQIEFVIPEIALEAQALALEFASLFESYQSGLKVIFADTGAAALARRDWGETWFKVTDLGSRFTGIETKVSPDDQIFLVVCPSSTEVQAVEKLCNIADDRPVILLIPQLEDVSIVGIGFAARQLRERFLSSLTSAYYFRPLEGVIVLRSYPSLWQVWLEKDGEYELIAEESQKPAGDTLEIIVNRAIQKDENPSTETPKPRKTGLLGNMQRILKALNQ
ncbi:DUF1995 domain-containing protein [Aphanothece hegewaldii CCALA 016]|uniref:DUF1995 domain-containing protein n=1 Tax=Aphanothece hegewaldii CCALA 016 TaxID=2107694 RepID=A0A2T1LTQ9_9CHRO|nr:DUF1995 family protein [Aphanothece hegewaldii]PSF34502.1 DUF1995 domain-containing protein [Aphanothece hegewaldii CCALA 016]